MFCLQFVLGIFYFILFLILNFNCDFLFCLHRSTKYRPPYYDIMIRRRDRSGGLYISFFSPSSRNQNQGWFRRLLVLPSFLTSTVPITVPARPPRRVPISLFLRVDNDHQLRLWGVRCWLAGMGSVGERGGDIADAGNREWCEARRRGEAPKCRQLRLDCLPVARGFAAHARGGRRVGEGRETEETAQSLWGGRGLPRSTEKERKIQSAQLSSAQSVRQSVSQSVNSVGGF